MRKLPTTVQRLAPPNWSTVQLTPLAGAIAPSSPPWISWLPLTRTWQAPTARTPSARPPCALVEATTLKLSNSHGAASLHGSAHKPADCCADEKDDSALRRTTVPVASAEMRTAEESPVAPVAHTALVSTSAPGELISCTPMLVEPVELAGRAAMK